MNAVWRLVLAAAVIGTVVWVWTGLAHHGPRQLPACYTSVPCANPYPPPPAVDPVSGLPR